MSKNIIIIGAGASGLIAALNLSKAGYSVIVLEARERVGGRIETLVKPFSTYTEAGAEFVHGRLPLSTQLLKQAKLNTNAMTGKSYSVFQGNLEEGEAFESWDRVIKKLNELEHDIPIRDFLDKNFSENKYPDLYHSIIEFVEGYDAADTQKVSSFALRDEWSENDDKAQLRISAGYSSLIKFLKEEFVKLGGVIQLNSLVTRIHWQSNEVQVEIQNGKIFTGNKVIVTIPVSLLQRETIRFYPDIGDYIEASKKIGFGGVIKFMFEFNDCLWERSPRTFKEMRFIFSDAKIPTWWSQLPDKRPLLTGWIGGPKTFEALHDQQMLYNDAVESLAYILNTSQQDIIQNITAWHIADWTKDPLSMGAYAYATIETNSAREKLTTPIASTIYFAGEALYEGPAMGTVEAALSSGLGTAQKIISAYTTIEYSFQ